MPKSKLEQKFAELSQLRQQASTAAVHTTADQQAQTVAPRDRESIDWQEIASNLVQKIDNTKQQISLLQKEVEVSRSRLRESEEAYQLVKNPPKWEPSAEQFELFHQLKTVISQQESEDDRLKKLEQIQQALELGRQVISQKEKQISLLEAELRNLQEDLMWATKYAPQVENFEAGYRYPAPQQTEIDRHTRYLWEAEQKLAKAKEVAGGNPADIQKWLSGSIHKSMNEAIAIHEQVVANEQQSLATAQRRNESHFKKYITARVDVEQPLREFLVAQERYKTSLEVFSPLIQEYGEILGLGKDDILRLANLNLPQIKDAGGRITVI